MRRSSIAVAASLGGASAVALIVLVAIATRAARSPPSTRDGAVDPDARSEAPAGPVAPTSALDRAPGGADAAPVPDGSGPWTIVGRVLLCANPGGHRDPSPAGLPVPAEGRGERATGEAAPADPDAEPPHEPVPGALVSVRRTASPDDPPDAPPTVANGTATASPPGTALPEATAITGPDGRFELRGAPRDAWVEVSIDRPGSALWRRREELREPEAPPVLDLGEVILLPAASLVVEVVDPNGVPVIDATVQAVQDEVPTLPVSDAAGAESAGSPVGLLAAEEVDAPPGSIYLFPRLAPGPCRIDALAPGHALASEQVELPRDEPLRIELARGGEIRGRVLSSDGSPIAGAAVRLQDDESGLVATRSDAAGAFVLWGLGQDPVSIEARAEGLVPAEREARPGWETEIWLVREATIAGRVAARADGKPLAGVYISVRPGGPGVHTADHTDARGEFRIGGLTADTYELVPNHEAWLPAKELTVELPEGGAVEGLLLELLEVDPGFSRTVRVLETTTGSPVAGASLRIWQPPGEAPVPAVSRSASTRADGACRVDGLREGSFTATVFTTAFLSATRIEGLLSAADPSDLVIGIDPGASISGRVLDPSGRPVPQALVRIRALLPEGQSPSEKGWRNQLDPSWKGLFQQSRSPEVTNQRTKEDGRFWYRGLPAGISCVIRAEAHGFAPVSTDEIRPSAQGLDRDVDIVLTDGGTILGRVHDARGLPIPEASISVRGTGTSQESAWDRRCAWGAFDSRIVRSTSTDSDGTFEVRALPAGTYEVEAAATGRPGPPPRRVEVREGAVTSGVDFACAPGAPLEGRLLGADGTPLEDETVAAVRVAAPHAEAWASTDSDGRFRFEALPEGTVLVSADTPWGTETTVQATVPGPPVEIRLGGGWARLVGRISARGGGPCRGSVQVRPWLDGSGWAEDYDSADCDATGRYEVWAPSGRLRIDFVAPGHAGVWREAVLAPGETRRIDVDLPAAHRLEGHVVDRATGAAVAGAEVRCDANSSPQTTKTDESGAFDLSVAEDSFEIVVTHPGRRPGRASGFVAQGVEVTPVVIELEAGPSLHGLVTLEGSPVAGAAVRVRGKDGSLVAEVRAGPDGLYDAPGLAPGIYEVSAAGTVEGDRTLETLLEANVPESGIARLDVDLLAVRATGRVLLDGRPVRGASVDAYGELGDCMDSAETDAEGRWSLHLRRGKSHLLSAAVEGEEERVFEVSVPEDSAEVRQDLDVGHRG